MKVNKRYIIYIILITLSCISILGCGIYNISIPYHIRGKVIAKDTQQGISNAKIYVFREKLYEPGYIEEVTDSNGVFEIKYTYHIRGLAGLLPLLKSISEYEWNIIGKNNNGKSDNKKEKKFQCKWKPSGRIFIRVEKLGYISTMIQIDIAKLNPEKVNKIDDIKIEKDKLFKYGS
jgi:uncharacterized GH25 family protein